MLLCNRSFAVNEPTQVQPQDMLSPNIHTDNIRTAPCCCCCCHQVFPGYYQGQRVAIKILQTSSEDSSGDLNSHKLQPEEEQATLLQRLTKEIRLQAQCSAHQNVVRFKAYSREPHSLLMEWCDGGTLHDAIRRQSRPLSTLTKVRYLRETAAALWSMHEVPYNPQIGTAPIVHGDIRPPNLLLGGQGPEWEIKVADFGLAEQISRNGTAHTNDITNALYVPADVLQQKDRPYKVTPALDLYAFGMVFYEMFAEGLPYEAELRAEQHQGANPGLNPYLDVTVSLIYSSLIDLVIILLQMVSLISQS